MKQPDSRLRNSLGIGLFRKVIEKANGRQKAGGSAKESGSAVVEFVALIVPLFIPFAMYLAMVNAQSQISFDAHNLARQIARAYITSPSEEFTAPRVQTVLDLFIQKILRPHGVTSTPTVQISCSATPCLTPMSEVNVTVTLEDNSLKLGGYLRSLSTTPKRIVAHDIQVVDAWRSSP